MSKRKEQFDAAKVYIAANRRLIWNNFTDLLENDCKEVKGSFEANLASDLIENEIDIQTRDLRIILGADDSLNSYNPFIDAIESYTGEFDPSRDYIAEYMLTLPCTLGFEDNGEFNPGAHVIYLKKWYVNMIGVACGTVDVANEIVPLILSKEQRTGKTYWVDRMLPEKLRKYTAREPVDKEKREMDIAATSHVMIFFDELGGLNKKDQNNLKSLLSQTLFPIRKLFTNIIENKKRKASFIGTANDIAVLSDETGNRRFMPINIDGVINWDAYEQIPREAMMKQAALLIADGFETQLTPEEIKYINDRTLQNKVKHPEEELISDCITLPDSDNNCNAIFSTTAIINSFASGAKGTRLSRKRLKLIMENKGYEDKVWSIDGTVKRGWKVNRSSSIGNQF